MPMVVILVSVAGILGEDTKKIKTKLDRVLLDDDGPISSLVNSDGPCKIKSSDKRSSQQDEGVGG